MREIKKGDSVLARVITPKDWHKGLNFFSQDKEFIQVGTWKYQKGKKLLPHIHNRIQRKTNRTQETIIVKKGKIKAYIYDLRGTLVQKVTIRKDDILVLLNCGHGYDILTDKTEVVEIKNGPYLGAEVDRKRI